MSVSDDKKYLRKILKQKRSQIDSKIKALNDKKILNTILNLDEIKKADIILTYVSTASEIDTQELIEFFLKNKKVVAAAKCEDEFGNMSFYKISSLLELKKSVFGIFEPEFNEKNKVLKFENSVCIVPALSFDIKRQRIGYGKGYYDRFLENYTGVKIGLCYDEMIEEKIPCDKYDIAVDMVVTQSKII